MKHLALGGPATIQRRLAHAGTREGPEWDRLHAAAVAYWPDILEYQTHTTRTFPLIVLDPIPDPARPR
jgi:hypothetical protein